MGLLVRVFLVGEWYSLTRAFVCMCVSLSIMIGGWRDLDSLAAVSLHPLGVSDGGTDQSVHPIGHHDGAARGEIDGMPLLQ